MTKNLKVTLVCTPILLACLAIPLCILHSEKKMIEDYLTQTPTEITCKTLPDSEKNRELVQDILETREESYNVLYKTVKIENGVIYINPVYEAAKLEAYFEQEGINSLERFNQFIQDTEFEPVPVCYSPVDLFEYQKGNCYAYTLLTMFFLEKYYPEQDYEIITEHYEDGEAHIYLKLIGQTEDMIVDLTKEKHLSIPN